MVHKAKVEAHNRQLEQQLEQAQRENNKLRSQAAVEPVKAQYFDRLFHDMEFYGKRRLIEFCRVELSQVFGNMPSNSRSVSAGSWEAKLNALFNKVEEFIYQDSGKQWKVRGVGDFSFRSYNSSKMVDKDFLRLTFAHPALKRNKENPLNQVQTATPTPTLAQLSVTIKNFEVIDRA